MLIRNLAFLQNYLKLFVYLSMVLRGWSWDGKHKLRLSTSQADFGYNVFVFIIYYRCYASGWFFINFGAIGLGVMCL